MVPFDIKTNFIDYWDRVIRLWLDNPDWHAINATRKSNRGENFYKDCDIEVNIEEDQEPFFNNNDIRGILCPAHMPEPYWGNPDNCSIVIVNYNPGGGDDMGIHTYKFTNGNPNFLPFPPNTMIDYVYKNSYSSLAKDFPIWKNTLKNRKWLSSYGGRDWWLQKKKWVQHLVDSVDKKEINVEGVPPFAIELCGWHSPNWPSGIENSSDNSLYESIKNHFVYPLLYAIEKSNSNIAVCIGEQFNYQLFQTCFGNAKLNYKNITNDIFKFLINGKLNINSLTSNIHTNNIIASTNDKHNTLVNRKYRVYDIELNGKHHIILNTYAQGGNHSPATHFWPFEKALLETIKNYKSAASKNNQILP